jgi:hypothetical protein
MVSDAQLQPNPAFTPGGIPAPAWRSGTALLLAATAAAALLLLALFFWRQQSSPAFSPGPLGVRYAVQLQNGQMFFGLLREIGPRHLQLEDVYYVQPYTSADGRPGNRLVNRQKGDWHGPLSLTIPLDRVVTVEQVGPTSQLARLIEEDRKAR